ncbi:MAG: hypothetical protein ABMA02_12615 [Saprospiraceae bacterium]
MAHLNQSDVDIFFNSLTKYVSRFIEQVVILPLYGIEFQTGTIQEAIELLGQYQERDTALPLVRFEVKIRYNTGDKIEASFRDRQDAIAFLEIYTHS